MRQVCTCLLLLTGSLLAGSLLAGPGASAAVDEGAGERPRIGLVLGGGGARGAAHIGVLKELERLRVPVDAVAGTSMGAIVGGLYAAGMTPAELEELVATIDWTDAFQDTPSREQLPFRRKQDDAAYPVQLELGLRDGRLLLPKGLIQGQKLTLILREKTLPVTGIEDFDDLPTPFRAVASDIGTGEPYVMSSGDLTLAMRASMSAPGIFAPVTADGRTLVDGGLVGNVPVDVVREMGVDIVIAVDVEFPLYAPESLESALQITEQVLTILIRKETLRQLAELDDHDILIRPELGEYGSTNFADITETIAPGVAAVASVTDRLEGLALDEAGYAGFQAARRSSRRAPGHTGFVRVVDGGPLDAEVLESGLETTADATFEPELIERDVEHMYGLAHYEQVSYRVVHEDGEAGVEFEARPKSWGPNFLLFGITVEDDFEGSTGFNFAARLTRTGINGRGAEWRNDLQIGTDPHFTSEFYQPLGRRSKYFVAPIVDLAQTNFNAFASDATIARYRVSSGELGVDVGRALGRWGEMRFGALRGLGNARVKVGDPMLPNIDFDLGGMRAQFRVDTLDDALIPKRGMSLDVEWLLARPGFGSDSRFDTVESELNLVRSWDRHTLQFGLEFDTTIESDNLIQNFFPLGGFLRLSGLERGEISGPHAGLARLVYYRRSGETGGGVFDMPLYFGGSIETGNVWRDRSDIELDSMIVNGSLFAGIDTYFGPVFLAAGFAEDGGKSFYLFLGARPR